MDLILPQISFYYLRKEMVNFYPLTHPILAKTKNHFLIVFGEYM